jgi:hypothetical protein
MAHDCVQWWSLVLAMRKFFSFTKELVVFWCLILQSKVFKLLFPSTGYTDNIHKLWEC